MTQTQDTVVGIRFKSGSVEYEVKENQKNHNNVDLFYVINGKLASNNWGPKDQMASYCNEGTFIVTQETNNAYPIF